jgi:hypothetical protein
MVKAKEFEFEKEVPVIDDEDEATLASIDEGKRDAKAGRTLDLQQVRKRLSRGVCRLSSVNSQFLSQNLKFKT